jgi:hypothetical protein
VIEREKLIVLTRERWDKASQALSAKRNAEVWVQLLAMQMDMAAAFGKVSTTDIVEVARAGGLVP